MLSNRKKPLRFKLPETEFMFPPSAEIEFEYKREDDEQEIEIEIKWKKS